MSTSDIPIRQGSNPDIAFRFPAGTELTGYAFELLLHWRDDGRSYRVGSGLTVTLAGSGDVQQTIVTWGPPVLDTWAFPPGSRVRYEFAFIAPSGQRRSQGGILVVEEGVRP